MTQTNDVLVFDFKANLVAVLNAKLEGANVELSDAQKEVVTQFLVDKSVLTVDKVLDLDGFTHFELNEDNSPVKTLLVNNFIVYLYEGTRVTPAHQADYEEYLEDNDLYSEDYQYDQFLRDNELVETFPSETYSYLSTVDVGPLYLNALREKEDATKRLEVANLTLEKIQPVISANFMPLGE